MYSVVGSDGQVYGPVDMQTLGRWIAEGRVTPVTNLIDPLDGRVVPAGHAPALMDLFPSQAPPMPGPAVVNPVASYPRPDLAPVYYGPPKTRLATALLAFFLGWLGIHRFYIGHTGIGLGMVALFVLGPCTCWSSWAALGIWMLVDTVLAATGALREANGRALE